MVYVKLVHTADGAEAVVQIGEHTGVVSPDAVRLAGGVLHVALPVEIEAPEACTVVERWLDPTPEQARLALEAIPDPILERLLAEESGLAGADVGMGVIVKRAVGRALTGDL